MNPAAQGYVLGVGVCAGLFLIWTLHKTKEEVRSFDWKIKAIEGRLPAPQYAPGDMPPVKVVIVGAEG